MSDVIETIEDRTSLTRREFTLEAALAILAGCVITVSDIACGSSTAAPTPVPPSDVAGTISANHGHSATITGAQITAGTAIVALSIMGTASHPHTLSVSQADLTSLKNKQAVTITSTTDANHSHTVTFTPS
jgi:phosphoribosylaminoimidazole (AIR) synthetase